MDDTELITNSIKCLAETSSIMSSVHERESEQCFFFIPFPLSWFLNPVPSDGKVSIDVRCLPSIAGKANFTCNKHALTVVS